MDPGGIESADSIIYCGARTSRGAGCRHDYLSWQKTDPAIVSEINGLIEEISRDPFKGTGKPEPLKGDLTAFWSRRITKADRLVYIVQDGIIYVMQCRYHYG